MDRKFLLRQLNAYFETQGGAWLYPSRMWLFERLVIYPQELADHILGNAEAIRVLKESRGE